MKKGMKKIFKNSFGLSLVEILIAVSILGVGSLAVMKTIESVTQESEKNSIQVDFEQFLFGLDNYLGRKDVCELQFLGKEIGTDIDFLRDPTSPEPENPENAVFSSGAEYLDGKIIIVSMKLIKLDDAIPALQVEFKRRDSKKSQNAYLYTRNISMVHELDATQTKIAKCYETVASGFNLAEKLCENNGIYDEVLKTCNFVGFGANTLCPDGQVITNFSYDPSTYGLTPVCTSVLTNPACPNTWITSISADGQVTCLPGLSSVVDDISKVSFPSGPAKNCGLDHSTGKIKFVCDSPIAPPPTCTEGAEQAGALISNVSNETYCGAGSGYTGNIRKYKRQVCIEGVWVESPGPAACWGRSQNVCDESAGLCTPPTSPTPPINCSATGIENTTGYIMPMGSGTFNFNTFTGSGCTPSGGASGCLDGCYPTFDCYYGSSIPGTTTVPRCSNPTLFWHCGPVGLGGAAACPAEMEPTL